MLVEPGAPGAYTTTARGHQALRQHPMGIDDSVLMAYPEFADFIHKLHQRPPPADIKASEYEQGYEAFAEGVEEICAVTSATAIITQSFLSKHLGQLFMWYHKPPYPARLFSSEADAIRWLENFKEE